MSKSNLKDYIEKMFAKYHNEDRLSFTIPFKFINFNQVSFRNITELCDTYNLILNYFPKDEYMIFEYVCQYYYDKDKSNKEKSVL